MIAIDVKGLGKVYKPISPLPRGLKRLFWRPFHTDFAALDNINFLFCPEDLWNNRHGAGRARPEDPARTLQPTSEAS